MTFLLLLTVLALVAVAATVRSAFHDAPTRAPRSHRLDERFLPPGDPRATGA